VYPCCHFTTDPRRALGNLNAARLRESGGAKPPAATAPNAPSPADRGRSLAPARDARFIHPLCLERAACAFNFSTLRPARISRCMSGRNLARANATARRWNGGNALESRRFPCLTRRKNAWPHMAALGPRGEWFLLTAALLWSAGGIGVKSLGGWSPWTISAGRSLLRMLLPRWRVGG
jgi:hypothetical protein